MAKILKKITLREIGLDKNALGDATKAATAVIEWREIKDDKDSVTKVPKTYAPKGSVIDVAQFIGSVSAVRPGEVKDTGQPFAKLVGQFEAVNLLTGESFTNSPILILPNFIGDSVADAVMKLNGNGSVDFAVKVTAQYDESSAVGYVFGAESLMPTVEADAVSAIKAKLMAQGIALAAPKAVLALAADNTVKADDAAPTQETTEAPAKSAKGRK